MKGADSTSKDLSADGLRGIAAASVALHHFLLAIFPLAFVRMYPWLKDGRAKWGITESVVSSPYLIALWNGQLPVCIFFVLSGYVLTRRFFRTGDAENIKSQAARRVFRLGIPVFFSVMLAYGIFTIVGYAIPEVMPLTRSQWLDHNLIRNADWVSALHDATYGALFQGRTGFNGVLWTMRVELIGSMLIFGYALLSARRHLLISAVYVALVIGIADHQWPYFVAFLIGAHIGRLSEPKHRVSIYLAAIAGYLIASLPTDAAWWSALHVRPSERLALVSVAGGAFIVYAVRFGALASVLRSRAAQFLGRVSYPLYLIHVPLLLSAGCSAFAAAIHHGASRGLAAAIALCAFLALTLPLSMLFERTVDAQAIRFGRWVIERRARQPKAAADLT